MESGMEFDVYPLPSKLPTGRLGTWNPPEKRLGLPWLTLLLKLASWLELGSGGRPDMDSSWMGCSTGADIGNGNPSAGLTIGSGSGPVTRGHVWAFDSRLTLGAKSAPGWATDVADRAGSTLTAGTRGPGPKWSWAEMSVCSGVCSGDGEPSSFVESTGGTMALDVDVMAETADEIDV